MKRRIFIITLFLVTLSAMNAAASVFHVTSGRYCKQMLFEQFQDCHDFQCPGCMNAHFPDQLNPFDYRHNANCEGLHPVLNWWYYFTSWLTGDDWVTYAIFTQKETLEQTVTYCEQRYLVDVHCHLDDIGYDIWGAYLMGSELSLGSLEGHIDYDDLDFPTEPNYYCWTPLREWVQYSADDLELDGWLPFDHQWGRVFYASMLYWADLTTENRATARERDPWEEEFALKCMAHSLVCWQSPYWENGQSIIDIIGPNGIEDWPFDHTQTPTFVYYMWDALWDIVDLPVLTEKQSWSAVKALYR